MKKHGKYVTASLFVILGIFVILQYQNCGNSSTNGNLSQVGPAGIAYTVTLTPNPASLLHGSGTTLQVRVQSTGLELTGAAIGYIQNGQKIQVCFVESGVPSQDWTNSICHPTFPTAGTYPLYVDILDPNFPPTEPMLDCNQYGQALLAGCQGTFVLQVN